MNMVRSVKIFLSYSFAVSDIIKTMWTPCPKLPFFEIFVSATP